MYCSFQGLENTTNNILQQQQQQQRPLVCSAITVRNKMWLQFQVRQLAEIFRNLLYNIISIINIIFIKKMYLDFFKFIKNDSHAKKRCSQTIAYKQVLSCEM